MLRPEQIQIGLSDPAQHRQAVITGIDFAGFVSTLNLQMAAGGTANRDQNRQPRRPAARFSGHSQRDGPGAYFRRLTLRGSLLTSPSPPRIINAMKRFAHVLTTTATATQWRAARVRIS